MALKDFIFEARSKRGLTQEALAEVIGKQKMWVSRRENGKNKITLKDLALICEALSVDIPWGLVGEEGDINGLQLPFFDKNGNLIKELLYEAENDENLTHKNSKPDIKLVPFAKNMKDVLSITNEEIESKNLLNNDYRVFQISFVKTLLSDVGKSCMIGVGKGASVAALNETDEILVDLTVRSIGENGIYLLKSPDSDDLVLRRCWKSLRDGLITVGSDNPLYPSEAGLPDDRLCVAGKAVWLSRRL